MSIAVIFPGQGSQLVGMGKDFYDSFEQSKECFEQCDNALGYKLSKIIFDGSEEELKLTQNTQPALVTTSIAIWKILSDKLNPSYFAGHSLGEYTAIHAANGMMFEDTVKAVHNRGKFMQSAVPVGTGTMAAVLGLKDEEIISICKDISQKDSIIEPANFNCNGQVVVAGHSSAFEKATEIFKSHGAKRVIILPVSAPFHCSLMEPAKLKMKDYLSKINISDLNMPIYNNIDAVKVSDKTSIKDGLIRQISGAVKWSESVSNMIKDGVDTFIEVGPGTVLSGLVKKINKEITCINISKVDDLEKVI